MSEINHANNVNRNSLNYTLNLLSYTKKMIILYHRPKKLSQNKILLII